VKTIPSELQIYPGGQGLQWSREEAPILGEYLPAGHFLAVVAPASQ